LNDAKQEDAEWKFQCFSPKLALFSTAGCIVVSTLIILCVVMLCVQCVIIVYCCWYLPKMQRQKAEAVLGDETERPQRQKSKSSLKRPKSTSLHKERVSSLESRDDEKGVEMATYQECNGTGDDEVSYHDSDDEVLNNDDEKELEYITPGGPLDTTTPGE